MTFNHQTSLRKTAFIILISVSFYLPQKLFCQHEIKAGVSGNLNCKNKVVTLKCNSNGEGLVIKWSGPNGFVSTAQNPETAIPGNYTLSLSNPLTGVSSTSSVIVELDTLSPVGVKVSGSGILTCKDSLVTLTGSSTTPNVNYQWQGPGDFTFYERNPEIGVAGNYLLIVTNPQNGCSSKAKVNILQDISAPENVSANAGEELNCLRTTTRLIGTTTTPNVNYKWEGSDGFSSSISDPVVSMPGKFRLAVTKVSNGCSITKIVEVVKNVDPPEDLKLAVSGKLTCKDSVVSISAGSTVSDLEYKWSGPDNFISATASPIVNIPGEYQVNITNPLNGCSSSKLIKVEKDISVPEGVGATCSGKINCNKSPVALTAKCKSKDVEYKWTGPDGFIASGRIVKTTREGKYTITVIKPDTKCMSTAEVSVKTQKCPE